MFNRLQWHVNIFRNLLNVNVNIRLDFHENKFQSFKKISKQKKYRILVVAEMCHSFFVDSVTKIVAYAITPWNCYADQNQTETMNNKKKLLLLFFSVHSIDMTEFSRALCTHSHMPMKSQVKRFTNERESQNCDSVVIFLYYFFLRNLFSFFFSSCCCSNVEQQSCWCCCTIFVAIFIITIYTHENKPSSHSVSEKSNPANTCTKKIRSIWEIRITIITILLFFFLLIAIRNNKCNKYERVRAYTNTPLCQSVW